MTDLKSKYGSYALITGAASGIGRAFAEILAVSGIHPIIVDINVVDAKQFVEELKERYQVDAHLLALDLAKPDFMKPLIEISEKLDIGLVIHCAAVSLVDEFLRIPLEKHRLLVSVNVSATMELAYYFGGQFKAKKRGGIILVSSA